MAQKHCLKFQPAEQEGARALQTDRWETTYSEREREFTFAKNRSLFLNQS